MSDSAGSRAAEGVKDVFRKVHGAGEALRGNVNEFADSLGGSDRSQNRATIEKGAEEIAGERPIHDRVGGRGHTTASTATQTADPGARYDTTSHGTHGTMAGGHTGIRHPETAGFAELSQPGAPHGSTYQDSAATGGQSGVRYPETSGFGELSQPGAPDPSRRV